MIPRKEEYGGLNAYQKQVMNLNTTYHRVIVTLWTYGS